MTLLPLIIAIVDTGFAPKYMPVCKGYEPVTVRASAQHGAYDNFGHGQIVARNIHEYTKNVTGDRPYCIWSIKVPVNKDGRFDSEEYLAALRLAASKPTHIVSLSIHGTQQLGEESVLVKRMLNEGRTVIAAAGNSGRELSPCNVFPACIDKRITVVGELKYEERAPHSNYGEVVDVWIHSVHGSGTSFAVGAYLGRWLRDRKHPPYRREHLHEGP